jgi:lysophospholipase L1-like esterase
MRTITLSLLLLFSISISTTHAQQITPFKDGDRAVFLGNSITDGGHYHSYIWLYYMTRFPDMRLTVLNAGIGGDTAENMFKRLDGDVFAKRPTVLITTFGMNDTGYFEYNGDNPQEFADKKVQESYNWYQKIEDRYKTLVNTRIVLMGSSPYAETGEIEGNTPFKNKNNAMERIVYFQEKSAEVNGWEFIDLNAPMTKINIEKQKTDPTFALCGNDRIHPDNDGHMVMAYLFLKAQGMAGKEVAKMDIDASKATLKSASNCEITDIKKTATGISFNYQSKALPYPMDTIARGWGQRKSQSKAADIVPFMEEMNQEILMVSGLKGNYRLVIDEEEIGTWPASDLAKGINLATLNNTPQYQQAFAIMHLNEERWEIERRFRDYAWVEFNFLQPRGLLFADNRDAIKAIDKEVQKDGWLRAKRDLYSKAMFPQIRQAWQDEMNALLSTIYELNQPLKRKITLIRVK